jgi:SSS family solute:Na+ symporter
MNAKGCLGALISGFTRGILRLAVETPVKLIQGFQYPAGSFLWIVNHIFFQYYSMIILVVSAAVMVAVSHMSAEPDYAKIGGLTYATRSEKDKQATRASWSAIDVVLSIVVLALILAAYLYFVG